MPSNMPRLVHLHLRFTWYSSLLGDLLLAISIACPCYVLCSTRLFIGSCPVEIDLLTSFTLATLRKTFSRKIHRVLPTFSIYQQAAPQTIPSTRHPLDWPRDRGPASWVPRLGHNIHVAAFPKHGVLMSSRHAYIPSYPRAIPLSNSTAQTRGLLQTWHPTIWPT